METGLLLQLWLPLLELTDPPIAPGCSYLRWPPPPAATAALLALRTRRQWSTNKHSQSLMKEGSRANYQQLMRLLGVRPKSFI